MSFLRKNEKVAAGEHAKSVMSESPVDRVRFGRLLEASLRLRDLGVDFETIQRRAADDDVSLNAALEAIDRERSHG